MRATLRGTELYYDVDGTALIAAPDHVVERPAAIIVHGGPGGDHFVMRARYGDLSKHFQLIYYDLRGHGRSAPIDPANAFSFDEDVRDLEALRDHLGIDQPIIIGTSYGGMVAMAHAARFPTSVSRLVLAVTAAHYGYARRAQEIVAARGTAEQQRMCAALFDGEIDSDAAQVDYFSIMAPLYSRRQSNAATQSGLQRAIFTPRALREAHGPNGYLRRFDLRDELAAIRAPTLILGGRHDWICAPEFSEELHHLIAGSRLRIFEDSSHNISADEPEAVLQEILAFLLPEER